MPRIRITFDVIDADDTSVQVIIEVPGVTKESLTIKATETEVIVKTKDASERKYDVTVPLKIPVDPNSAVALVRNGILEITFGKKNQEIKRSQKEPKEPTGGTRPNQL